MDRSFGRGQAGGALFLLVAALGCGSIAMVDDVDGGGGQGGGLAGAAGVTGASGTLGTAGAGGSGTAGVAGVAGRGGVTGTAGGSGTTGAGNSDGGLFLIDAETQKDTGQADTGRADAGQCTPGDHRCDPVAPNTPMTCDDSGAWQRAIACSNICSMGACAGVCTPGAKTCVGNLPQLCDGQGQWQSAPSCNYVCRMGNCTGVCIPGARQCSATGLPQSCNADGAWEDGTACPFVCNQGQCTGVCKPGATGCSSNVPQTCSASGSWVLGNACPFVCSAGACAGSCTPGARQCANEVPQTCSSSGTWTSGSACPFVCTQATGMCGGTCAPGTNRCTNGQRQMCDATGGWQNTPSQSMQLLTNPGFDAGHSTWIEESESTSQIITNQSALTTITAQSPPYVGWLGGYDDAVDDLYQFVTIPAGATSISLSFYYAVRTAEVMSSVNDSVDVYTYDTVTSAYTPIATFTNNTSAINWTRFTASLPLTLAGKTFEVGFLAETNGSKSTSFFVDSVALDVTVCTP